jgi:hypothetical protein
MNGVGTVRDTGWSGSLYDVIRPRYRLARKCRRESQPFTRYRLNLRQRWRERSTALAL